MSNATARAEMIAAQLALRERSRREIARTLDIWVVTEQDAGVIKARPAYDPDAISQPVSVVAGALCFLDDEILVVKVAGRWFTLGATRGGFTDADADILVESVNGMVGAVVLDADDISDSSTVKKFVSAMEKSKLAGVQAGATANDTDANLKNRANHTGTQTVSTISDFTSATDSRISIQKAANNGLATLDAAGRVPSAQLPAIVMTEVYSVSSQAAQLALTAQEGDVAVRTDESKSYIHNGGTAGTMADWTLLATPSDVVQSVNGKTGSVSLTTTDIAEGTNLYYPSADKSKLAGIQAGAEVNVQSNWNASSGDAFIQNKPTLGTAAAQNVSAFATAAQGTKADSAVQPGDLADVATSGDYIDLTNKPTIPTQFNPIAGTNVSLSGTYPNITFNASGGGGAVDSVNGQTGTVVLDADDIDDTSTSHKFATAAQLTKLNGIEAGAQVNVTPTWGAVTGKPSEFPPEPHNHDGRYYTETEVDAIIAALAIPQTKGNTTPGSASISMDSAGTTVLTGGHVLTFSGLITGRTYEVTWVISARNGSGGSGAYRITAEVIGNSTSMPTYGAFVHGGNLESTTGTGRTTMVPNGSGVITVAPAITRDSGSTRISQVNIVATVS